MKQNTDFKPTVKKAYKMKKGKETVHDMMTEQVFAKSKRCKDKKRNNSLVYYNIEPRAMKTPLHKFSTQTLHSLKSQ